MTGEGQDRVQWIRDQFRKERWAVRRFHQCLFSLKIRTRTTTHETAQTPLDRCWRADRGCQGLDSLPGQSGIARCAREPIRPPAWECQARGSGAQLFSTRPGWERGALSFYALDFIVIMLLFALWRFRDKDL